MATGVNHAVISMLLAVSSCVAALKSKGRCFGAGVVYATLAVNVDHASFCM